MGDSALVSSISFNSEVCFSPKIDLCAFSQPFSFSLVFGDFYASGGLFLMQSLFDRVTIEIPFKFGINGINISIKMIISEILSVACD